jgi:hypothetical protein
MPGNQASDGDKDDDAIPAGTDRDDCNPVVVGPPPSAPATSPDACPDVSGYQAPDNDKDNDGVPAATDANDCNPAVGQDACPDMSGYQAPDNDKDNDGVPVGTDPNDCNPAIRQYGITLTSLHCGTTEDWSGADEPYLVLDGQVVWGPGSLNDGQTAYFNVSRVFASSVTIDLYDDDSPDADDSLGRVIVGSQVGQGSARFTLDDVDYTLTYHVTTA